MTELRRRMIQDMELRGLKDNTQKAYLDAVKHLARHYGRSPDLLSEEEIRRLSPRKTASDAWRRGTGRNGRLQEATHRSCRSGHVYCEHGSGARPSPAYPHFAKRPTPPHGRTCDAGPRAQGSRSACSGQRFLALAPAPTVCPPPVLGGAGRCDNTPR